MAYLDLTTFTEVDPLNHWAETSTRATYTGLLENENSYVYKDYGVNYFGLTFKHYVDIQCNFINFEYLQTNDIYAGIWAITDVPGDSYDLVKYIMLQILASPPDDNSFKLMLFSNTASGYPSSISLSKDTSCYLSIERNEAIVTCKIYSSSSDRINDINIIDTITLTDNSSTDKYRYLQCGYSDGYSGSGSLTGYNENFDLAPSGSTTIQKTILSNVNFKGTEQKIIISNVNFIDEGVRTITSDVKFILPQEQKTIISDVHFKAIDIQETILSDVKFVIQSLYNINQKFNFVKLVLPDVTNKINTVIQVFSDINNFINTCKSVISDVANDFRTKKLTLNNVTNDIRFMYSWQKAADGTLQSLGKGYIKVYIGGAEQTDVDVDSISISKDLDIAHSASFDLGRAYDATKPAMEATIEIKYNNWTLFSGYITSISPSEDPEKMRINCQNEYWKQNKSNVYYHIGHKPQDDKELYYETLQEALSTEHGWIPGIGNFVPEVIDNFAVGKSDAITNLIQAMGNYSWFYDVDNNKKLWTAGSGSIIELERQKLGENINLYDVINHSFDESVEDIVNKFRVQMGEKVIRKFDSTGGSRTYTGYNYSFFQGFLTPAWESSYEKRAGSSVDGYGYDYPEPGKEKEYGEVFKKFNIPYLNPELSSWSDRFPPKIEIHSPGGYYYVGMGTITEGFTIDYENRILTFNQPQPLYMFNNYGEVSSVRAPLLKLFLWKKNYYPSTGSSSEDPETDVSNPLMFFTDKMGNYPDTIIKDLNLSNLSIQEGGTYIDSEGITQFIPSWDDTDFAKDIANWQLSKKCDKKIRGTIVITLDAFCFYNIDLSKRIYINGITEIPMNIISMGYNLSNFTVSLQLENSRYYNRTVSFVSHGE